MTAETKKIGEYTCYKATAVVATDATDFRNFRMRGVIKIKRKKKKKKQLKQRILLMQIRKPTLWKILSKLKRKL